MISVIIPIFNKEKFLHKSIDSVLNQNFKNFELILVNDGSTDNSAEIIERYAEKYKEKVVYIKQHNQGVSVARNTGIKSARGEYIAFLDADDEYDVNFLKYMDGAIGNKDIVVCRHYKKDSTGKLKKSKMKSYVKDILESFILNKIDVHTNSWLIRKQFLNESNIYFDTDLKYGEDMLFFIKLLSQANMKRIGVCNRYLTTYTLNIENSLSSNTIDKIYLDKIWIYRAIEYLEANDHSIWKNKRINALKKYRLPVAVIYRLASNKNSDKYDVVKGEMIKEINMLSLNNGLRSLKALYFKIFKL